MWRGADFTAIANFSNKLVLVYLRVVGYLKFYGYRNSVTGLLMLAL